MRYQNPDAQWISSPNFWAGRNGHDMSVAPAVVVIHTVVGSLDGAVATFQNWANQKSAHYIVGMGGRLVQMVDEGDAAWHAGTQVVNEDSIGIEHEDGGNPNSPRPDALYATSAKLVRGICQRYGIPIQHGNYGAGISGVVAHRDVFQTGCPDTLDVDRIIRQAAAGALPPAPTLSRGGDEMLTYLEPDAAAVVMMTVTPGGDVEFWRAASENALIAAPPSGLLTTGSPLAGHVKKLWGRCDPSGYVVLYAACSAFGTFADGQVFMSIWQPRIAAAQEGWQAVNGGIAMLGTPGPAGPPGPTTDATLRFYLREVPQ